ncbi:MAG: tetratricopeptide repeat protein, partial [Verrucomicrobiota bacterium]|nr:tetratricopeptide repeat protein [Verrucomicrobiota bacterium]
MPPALEHFRADPVAASEKDAFLARFAALGYLDLESENARGVHYEMRATNAWNIGQALFSSARPLEALPYLEEAFYYRPEQVHLAEPLARCQLLLGLTDEALKTCESLRDYADSYPNIALKLVDVYRLAGQVDAAFEILQQAADNGLPPATVAFHRGLCYMRNGEHQKALEAYEAAQTAEESMLINLAKSSSLIGLKRYGDAESLVDSVLANGFISADAYFYKGQILAQTEAQREAQLMFAEALKVDPNYLNARIGFSRRELEILRRDDKLKPYMAEHFDFDKGGTVLTQTEKKRAAFIAKVRAESVKRHEQWDNQIQAHRAKELYSIMLDKSTPPVDTSKPVIIVTGLPRSGTSLMMQMLVAAGITVQTDSQRTADV